MSNGVIKGNVGELYVLSNGLIKDQSGLSNFHPNSNTNLLIINIEDGGGENTMAQINFAPETRKNWSSVWFPLFFRGFYSKKISNESRERTFAQYVIPVPDIVLAMNLNNATVLPMKITFRQIGGIDLVGIYNSLDDLLNEKPATEELSDNLSVVYVYQGSLSGFYQVFYNDTSSIYEWVRVDRPTSYLDIKHYNMGNIKVQGGFGSHKNIAPLNDAQYELIWQELSNHGGMFGGINVRLENIELDINNILGNIDSITNRVIVVEQDLDTHILDKDNPHYTTPHKIGTYTDTEIDNKVQGAKDFTYSRSVIDDKDTQVLSEAKAYADNIQLEADLSNFYNKPEIDEKLEKLEVDGGYL